jgi:glycosyltransferase involved in cell wall biosynthesis
VHTPEPAAGAGQYVAEFAKSVAAQGETVTLFCPRNFSYGKDVAASGVELVLAPSREVGFAHLGRRIVRNIVFAIGALEKFITTVRRGDIVHFQFAMHLGLGLLFFLMTRIKGAFIVMTVHDPVPHRWILPRPLCWLETALLSVGYSLSDRLIVHNEAGRLILVKQFHIDPRAIQVIPHGPLNLACSKTPDQTRELEQPLRLLAFGSLRENKGLHLSIAAIQHLRRGELERPVCLTIAGCVPNLMERTYWESCQRLIQTQPDGITVIERVIEDAEVGPLFASHDGVLLPYIQFFSDSGVAMLAISQQRPILATDAGGLGELLRATDCGILIETPTVKGVVASIEKALDISPESLQRKGMNGYTHALTGRSWCAIARQTSALYTDLIGAQETVAKPARVVLHTPEPASSAALYVEALSKALAADGVPVRVVCPANHQAIPTMEADPLIDVHASCERGTRTNVSLLTKIFENMCFVLSSASTLLQATRAGDIVHFQYILHLPFGLIFFLCAWVKRARIAFTVHDPLPHKFLFPSSFRLVEMLALRLAYRWSDVLIVHSEAGKRKLSHVFQIPGEKIHVIVHGPYELKKRVEPCSEINRLEVLFFGSLRENKAPHLAIQAVQQLAAEGIAIRLTIAGQVVNRKEESYWAGCRTLIDPQSSVIRLLEKFVPDEDLPELFSNCHCFLLPYTTFSSDSGVAYMALANGKPLVSTGAGGLHWLLENSQGGISIADASVEGVAAGLRVAVGLGPANLEKIGRTGAAWLLANCGWPRVARETRELYAALLPELSLTQINTEVQETVASVGALP